MRVNAGLAHQLLEGFRIRNGLGDPHGAS
jgi:hypothetical protein